MMRTRNFRVRSEIVERERGAATNSQKRKRKPTLKGKGEHTISGQQKDNVLKTHVVSAMDQMRLATDARLIEQKDDRPPAQEGETPSKKFRQQRRKPFRQKEQNSLPISKM